MAPDLIVYLRTLPSTVFRRVASRMRAEEAAVSLEYLTEVHQFYESWLNTDTNSTQPATDSLVPRCPIVVINAEGSAEQVICEFEAVLK